MSNNIRFSLLIIPAFIFFSFSLLAQNAEVQSAVKKMGRGISLIDYYYVDDVDANELVEKAFREMLEELDPHSVYMDAEETKEANEPLQGKFEGIGIQFQLFKDTILVVSPITGGPSEKLGILAGDKIITIDGEEAYGEHINNEWVRKHLRGDKGTQVTVEIYRKGQKNLLEYTITRDKIPIHSVDASYMATPSTGYIKINRFSRTTMSEYAEAMGKLQASGMKNLILDLRNNTGGYLDVAISLADEFLKQGELVVYTEGRRNPRRDAHATGAGRFEKGKLIVLINEGSASASEIVSGAVQDWDRGLIIGRRSFGKGLVQRPFWLPDSSQIRLTIARYYTPTGRCIQKPYDDGSEAYFKDLATRMQHGEMMHADSISFPDSLRYTTPAGRTVYGGGGIMPDLFVPYDSTKYSDYYTHLWRKGVQNSFVTNLLNAKRQEYEASYPTFEHFEKTFVLDEELLEDFVQYAEKEGVERDEEGLEQSITIISAQIKALMARNLFSTSRYFQVVNTVSDEFNLALEMMQDDEAFSSRKISY
ncbi:MAG: peptidase S41 [Bacteroidetes bacterium]|nr:MAG: peptidase S41 [Bacteroidota bacterium]